MGALEDPPFVASLLDIEGALKTTGFPALQIAMGCEGRSFSMVALQCPVIDTEDLIGVYCNVTISIPILHLLHH
ncbi:hypothetical protein Tco_0748325 [Tanacetum coccineum]|uniref:Uncharacterized protein n=1 Tax=Tanacetum coccineum TaxID=301880 RepID=A0ABQ4YVB8_9ASTR